MRKFPLLNWLKNASAPAKHLPSSSNLFRLLYSNLCLVPLDPSHHQIPKLVCYEVKAQYSAAVGSRQAALLKEGKDPMPRFGRIQSAHAQINAGGEENLSNSMLVYAMIMAPPGTFATIKQNSRLRSPLSSAEVGGAVQAEWAGQRTTGDNSALVARQQGFARNGDDNKARLYGPHKNAYCTEHKAYRHDASKCIRLHVARLDHVSPVQMLQDRQILILLPTQMHM